MDVTLGFGTRRLKDFPLSLPPLVAIDWMDQLFVVMGNRRLHALKRAAESQSWGADLIYASGMVPEKFAPLSEQHYPCGGHCGYRPVNDTCKLLSVPRPMCLVDDAGGAFALPVTPIILNFLVVRRLVRVRWPPGRRQDCRGGEESVRRGDGF